MKSQEEVFNEWWDELVKTDPRLFLHADDDSIIKEVAFAAWKDGWDDGYDAVHCTD